MRILHIISTTDPAYGGPVESVAQLGTCLSSMGVTVQVAACADSPDAEWLKRYPLEVHALGPGLGNYGYSPRLVPWLRDHGGGYDVWIINGIWHYHAVATARVARELRKPYLVYTHGMLDPWSRRAHPLKYVKKLVYWTLFEQFTLRHASAVCFTAQEEARLSRQYFPMGAWRSFVVGAGVESPESPESGSQDELLSRYAELRGKRVWLFLSRLHAKKGLDLLLRSFAKAAREDAALHLLVVGAGERSYVAKMRSLARKLGLESRTTFAGPMYGPEKWRAYRMAELFVLPSHQENFGIVVAEALAVGLPVCISNRINIWKEVADSAAGLVCDDDVQSLDRALEGWNRLSGEERDEYGVRARACFEAHFHIRQAASRLLDMVRAAKEGRGRDSRGGLSGA